MRGSECRGSKPACAGLDGTNAGKLCGRQARRGGPPGLVAVFHCSNSFAAFTRRSTRNFNTSVTSASKASSEATANAAANWYSL